ncbi:hypothetical protein ROZALSC1DRAFT_28129 [Rozella allomycis CSF55]|uniref:Nucleotide-diphospho-sugar transferase domain-containing protein n=1 Tax=Rozella allomycis (strain CSF55) TaxID=988480 RepID=A0A075AXL1_ROZAC|nr:hypothetical protein O9G_001208 [Rozella allomycis CSF55]RKP20380.1 hypothetical protein ROZALSC1DRAFT_28129 [Rozella allomycis CSF55]|eukprot:EPZ33457.1 hypothetical protein O9G_001208 [Rozella allomycis CSF55]
MKGWARTEFKKFIILSSAIFGLFLLIKFLSLFASDIESSSKIQSLNSSWIKTDSLVFIKRQKRIPTSGILLVFGIHSPIIPNYQERFKKAGGRSTLYLKELNRVIDSIRATNKAISITVATDDVQAIPDEIARKVQNIFLQKLKTRAPWGDKTPAMLQSPYENTLFLDLDTLVCGDIKPIFKLLDNFDMAVVMEVLLKQQFLDAHVKNYDPSAHFNAIFETNSGVLLYKKTKETLDFLNSVYYSHEKGSDQHYYHLTSPLGAMLDS